MNNSLASQTNIAMIYSVVEDDKEVEIITRLINQAYRDTGGKYRWTTEAHLVAGDRITTSALSQLIKDANCDFIVCQDQNQVIGCISVYYQKNIAEFGTFAIQQDRQGTGLGKQLLAYAENHAKARCQFFQVSVVTPNRSLIDFYIKRGYQMTGSKKLYPIDDNVGQPKIAEIDLTVLQKSAAEVAVKF